MNVIIDEYQNEKANSIRFNQDYSMFSMATERGYKIYQTFPLSDNHEKNLSGGLSICEMSYRSNYLALVGGGTLPKFSNKKVVIYNDNEECIESEFKFTTPVINVKFKKNIIFIVCEKKIYVFNVENCQNIDCFDTIINKRGIIAVNGSPNKTIMAHPIAFNDQPDKGYVGIKNYKTNKYFPLLVHDEPISFMEMDYYGLLLATCNDKGTIIRIHSCADKTLLYECKRGKDKTIINFISFDIDYKYMGIASEKGTIHIWKLDDIIEKNNNPPSNENKIIIKNVENDFVSIESSNENKNDLNDKELIDKFKIKKIKHYKTETSFAKIRINHPKCIFSFVPGDIVIIISSDEQYYFSKLENKGGYCLLTGKPIKKEDD